MGKAHTEGMITDLYNTFYSAAMQAGRPDIDATLWAYEQACQTAQELNRQEIKVFLRERKDGYALARV